MSDKVFLFRDKCCHCSGTRIDPQCFGCEINGCSELHVDEANCLNSFGKVNSV